MAALLLMVTWNISETHEVVDLPCHTSEDDVIAMLLCVSLTVLFDMVTIISVRIVLTSLLFMCCTARMARLTPVVVDVPDDILALCVTGPLFFTTAEGLFTDLKLCLGDRQIVILEWDAIPVLGASSPDTFQYFVERLPEECELRMRNLEFQPLRTMARAGIQPTPGDLVFSPSRHAAVADLRVRD